ncbi:MAG: homoserine dehydrogenase [Planctomycetes bacterium]|nr:homoserine dehydrogenase [Planctomycetota bacterium]
MPKPRPLRIGMLGMGTVGTGVAILLQNSANILSHRAGRELQLVKVLVKNPSKKRDTPIHGFNLVASVEDITRDPDIDVVVEVVGGTGWAFDAMAEALSNGKDVVTANKAVLATRGRALFDIARAHRRCVAFEASVGGGIPIIGAIQRGLSANRILGIQGILNGTCNYILTRMTDDHLDYPTALKGAQDLGFAEADPTLDVNGTDAAHKLAVLAHLAMDTTLGVDSISRRGIDELDPLDIRFAGELGYTIRLLAEIWCDPDGIISHVSPVLLRKTTPLAQVRGGFNAVRVIGDAVGETLFYGAGAGRMPTASAVVSDLVELASSRDGFMAATARLWGDSPSPTLLPQDKLRSRYYLRLHVLDRPGVMAEVSGVLASHSISIASVIQHETIDQPNISQVQMVIMTHLAPAGKFLDAVRSLDSLGCILAKAVHYPVGE